MVYQTDPNLFLPKGHYCSHHPFGNFPELNHPAIGVPPMTMDPSHRGHPFGLHGWPRGCSTLWQGHPSHFRCWTPAVRSRGKSELSGGLEHPPYKDRTINLKRIEMSRAWRMMGKTWWNNNKPSIDGDFWGWFIVVKTTLRHWQCDLVLSLFCHQ